MNLFQVILWLLLCLMANDSPLCLMGDLQEGVRNTTLPRSESVSLSKCLNNHKSIRENISLRPCSPGIRILSGAFVG